MSRFCAPKSPRTPRRRASGSSAARPTTARGGPSRSSAWRGLSKRRPFALPPKRGRNATDVQPVEASPSGPSEGGPQREDVNGRRVQIIRKVGVGRRGQALEGLKADRASGASTALQREVRVIVEAARRGRGAPA